MKFVETISFEGVGPWEYGELMYPGRMDIIWISITVFSVMVLFLLINLIMEFTIKNKGQSLRHGLILSRYIIMLMCALSSLATPWAMSDIMETYPSSDVSFYGHYETTGNISDVEAFKKYAESKEESNAPIIVTLDDGFKFNIDASVMDAGDFEIGDDVIVTTEEKVYEDPMSTLSGFMGMPVKVDKMTHK